MLFLFGPIVFEALDDGGRRLTMPCEVRLNGQLLTTIPAGFESDGMSFPWWARMTWDDRWHDRYAPGAWLHDWLLDCLARDATPLRKWEIDWLAEGCWRWSGVSALETWIFSNAIRARVAR